MHIFLHTDKKNCCKYFNFQAFAAIFSGKEGIRTPEALLTLTRFPGGPLQPLEHLSVNDFRFSLSTTFYLTKAAAKLQLFSNMTKKMYICILTY